MLFPRKKHLGVGIRLDSVATWVQRLEEAGLDAYPRDSRVIVRLAPGDLDKDVALLSEVLKAAATSAG